jgi:poly(A) polymerase
MERPDDLGSDSGNDRQPVAAVAVELRLDAGLWRKRRGMAPLLDALGAGEGFTRYVGGAVRDKLLELPVNDVDLATRLRPQQVIERLEGAGIKVVPTGLEHGTVTAVSHGCPVEVTTLRRDVSTDGRRATVAFTDDWKEDAARRDFTINALSADPASGEIFDYFGGLDDLKARRVRFIGDPIERIAEDHLRILRFFRFHARFGKGEPDPEALDACARRANDLMALSRERIADELLKLLGLAEPSSTVAVMLERGILAPVLPEVRPDRLPDLKSLAAAERSAGIGPDAVRRLAALLPADQQLAERIAARLKLSNKARKRLACAVVREVADGARALAYYLGSECAVDRLLLDDRPQDAVEIEGWSVPKLPFGGGALIERGLSQGPEVARTLRRIEKRWVEAGFPSGAQLERIVAETLGSSGS